jgi:hypothetical protein
MSTIVKLSKPIQAHGNTLTELTLNEPRGKDIAACGLPRIFTRKGDTTSMSTDTAVIHAYIVRLGNIPPSSADALSAADWIDVMNAVLDFFASAPEAAADGAPAPPPPPAPGITIPFQTPASPETRTSSPSS